MVLCSQCVLGELPSQDYVPSHPQAGQGHDANRDSEEKIPNVKLSIQRENEIKNSYQHSTWY